MAYAEVDRIFHQGVGKVPLGEFVSSKMRPQVIEMYSRRLERLLDPEFVNFSYLLSTEEQKRLKSRAIISTVDALTDLGVGAFASNLLRQSDSSTSLVKK